MGTETGRRVGLFSCSRPSLYDRSSTLSPSSWDEKLTAENQAFLDQIIHETYANKESPLKDGPWQRGQFTNKPEPIRTGVLGLKLGTLPQWDKKGHKFYVTLVQVRHDTFLLSSISRSSRTI